MSKAAQQDLQKIADAGFIIHYQHFSQRGLPVFKNEQPTTGWRWTRLSEPGCRSESIPGKTALRQAREPRIATPDERMAGSEVNLVGRSERGGAHLWNGLEVKQTSTLQVRD